MPTLTSTEVLESKTPITDEGRWLYAKIYRSGNLDSLILDQVHPFTDRLRSQHLCDRFFFVRYWEGGQHLRVRWHLTSGVGSTSLKTQFADEITTNRAVPETTVEFDAYVREVLRYGGPDEIESAETYFEASSRAVLAVLPQCKKSSSFRIFAAMELLILQLLAAGLSPEQCISFCRCNLLILEQYCLREAAQERIVSYEDRWTQNDKVLTSFARQVLAKNDTRRNMSSWLCFCRSYWAHLYEKAAIGGLASLTLSPTTDDKSNQIANQWGKELGFSWNQLTDSLSPTQRAALPILLSQVHMTHNRLGIAKLDEPFVAYLTAKALEHLC